MAKQLLGLGLNLFPGRIESSWLSGPIPFEGRYIAPIGSRVSQLSGRKILPFRHSIQPFRIVELPTITNKGMCIHVPNLHVLENQMCKVSPNETLTFIDGFGLFMMLEERLSYQAWIELRQLPHDTSPVR
jgi:hypothetical protein